MLHQGLSATLQLSSTGKVLSCLISDILLPELSLWLNDDYSHNDGCSLSLLSPVLHMVISKSIFTLDSMIKEWLTIHIMMAVLCPYFIQSYIWLLKNRCLCWNSWWRERWISYTHVHCLSVIYYTILRLYPPSRAWRQSSAINRCSRSSSPQQCSRTVKLLVATIFPSSWGDMNGRPQVVSLRVVTKLY